MMQSQTTQTDSSSTKASAGVSTSTLQERLLDGLTPILESLGFELVFLEVQTHRAKTIRIFIDHLDSGKPAIGVEDCAHVSRALDEPLEKLTEGESILAKGYELEVSSPGVDRPLRKPSDFERFREREVRLHVFRPLTTEEIRNDDYLKRNPKQKNFLGILKGLRNESVLLAVSRSMGSTLAQSGKSKKKASEKNLEPGEKFDDIEIPLQLISKANIEPNFGAALEKEE